MQVRCSQCGAEALSGQRFCGQCGARFPAPCASCGASNPSGFRFCGGCGAALDAEIGGTGPAAPASYTPAHLAAKILTGRSGLEGERRLVTVLFADIAGFTRLAERLDPEDVRNIVDRCVRVLVDEVYRYEGTVTQFTGDGVMALFGAPIAHENAPERAVRAALDMQAALTRLAGELRAMHGIDVQMRIGINSGLVVVGRIGDDLRMEYTAVGDTTNLAARLQTAGTPGGILVSEHTAKLVQGRFATRAVGPLALKGKSEPVVAYEVLRALPRAPLVAGGDHGLTPLVGRGPEVAALERLFHHVTGGHGQVAFVVGEAGIGKSRLIHELRQRLAAHETTWLEGRCVSFGQETPFLPLIDTLKASFGIDEVDEEPAIVDKVRAGLAALDAALDGVEPYLRTLLAVDPGDPAVRAMEASARRFAIFDALKQVMLASAARRSLVILIEDLHWIDRASEEYLTYIIDALAAARVLLLCTYRPGYKPPFGERSFITRLALQPLSAEETATVAAGMLGEGPMPPEIRALIAAKAEGNPFFTEEVTKCLIETGALVRTDDGLALGRPVGQIAVPDRIQDVIMARIDRLGDAPKRAIQIASVIGREFAVRLLRRAADFGDGLDHLVGELRALELIYEKSAVPELAYMFKHALTHDVAYASLLVQRRRQLHRLIGLAIEELYADRLAEHAEMLAHHFQAGEDWPRAFDYLVKAGEKAGAAYANGEAIHFFNAALDVAARLDLPSAARTAVYRGKAVAHFCRSEFPEAAAAYRRAIELESDAAVRGALTARLAEVLVWAHEFDEAIAAATEAVALAGGEREPGVAAEAGYVVAFVKGVRGELDEVGPCLDAVDRLAERAGAHARLGESRVFRALTANWRGNYRTALDGMESVLQVLEGTKEWLTLAQVYSHYTITLGGAGRYTLGLAKVDEALRLSESIGDKVWLARVWNTRGWMLGDLGAHDAAVEANRRCLEIATQLGSLRMTPELVGNAEANLADLALARGDLAGAERHVAAVAALVADPYNEWMTWRYGMHFRVAAAELALARGDLARAQEHLAACLATAERTGSRRYLVRAHRVLAECRLAAGDTIGAERLLGSVVADARALGNPPQLWHALLAWGRALEALGRRDDALAAWREGRAAMERAAADLPVDLRAVFGAAPIRLTFGQLAG